MRAGGRRSKTIPPAAFECFSYHRSISPTLGVLLGLAIVETLVVHTIATGLWGWHVAIMLGLIDLSAVVMLVQLLRAIRRYPVTIGEGVLTMRVGRLKAVEIPIGSIRGLRTSFDAESLKARDTINLALANYPNVVVEVDPPLALRRRTIAAVAHKLDEPGDFAAAIERIKGGG